MTETVLRLRAHDVWSALVVMDPVAVLVEDLIGRTVDRSGHASTSVGLVPWRGSGRTGGELVLLEHPNATHRCLMPANSLRASLAAALAAVAARELLVSGGATVAMLGSAETTQAQLAVIARHVPDISHVALYLAGSSRSVEPTLADQLELSDIGLSVVHTFADAVFGANLVIATDHDLAHGELNTLHRGQFARGVVLINATGTDLPADLVDQVDQVFVDDHGLLDDHRDRHVVTSHRTEPATGPTNLHGGAGPRISADLCDLLTGRHAGRRRTDDMVLVELLGAQELNTELAYRIYEAARRTGLGEWITN